MHARLLKVMCIDFVCICNSPQKLMPEINWSLVLHAVDVILICIETESTDVMCGWFALGPHLIHFACKLS